MDCTTAIALLEERFDEHTNTSPELKQHLTQCVSCAAKADDLLSLERMLNDMPYDAPEGIEDKVLTAIAEDKAYQRRPVRIGILVACVLFAASVLNWFYAGQGLQTKARNYLNTWIPDTEWLGTARPVQEQLELSWSKGQSMMTSIEWISSSVVWGTLVATVVVLMLLNAVCVAQMRHTHQ